MVMSKMLAASLFLALIAGSTSAQAQARGDYKYCMQENGRGTSGNAPDCRYRTLSQCKQAASGGAGYCMKNPAYR
jgi:hypothetical protein